MNQQEFAELKKQAAEFYAKNEVPQRIEDILNSMFHENPTDVYGRLADYFEKFALKPIISSFICKQVFNCCGDAAIKCFVNVTVKNHNQVLGSSLVSLHSEMVNVNGQPYPENASPPTIEEVCEKNCTNINELISFKLQGIPLLNQREVDKALSDWINDAEYCEIPKAIINEHDDILMTTPTPSSGKKKKGSSAKGKGGKAPDKPIPPKEPLEKRLLGCTSVSAASLSTLKASAAFLQRPPFEHLHHSRHGGTEFSSVMDIKEKITMPTVAMTILSGGKHAAGKLNLYKHVFVIANPGWAVKKSMEKLMEIYRHVGKTLSGKGGASAQTGLLGAYQPPYDKQEQALDVIMEAINSCGLTPAQDVYIGVECAAYEYFDYDKGKYEVAVGLMKTADDMVDLYRDIVTRYPALIMLIDPLRKEDREQWPKLCEVISEKCFVIGGEAIYGPMHTLNTFLLTARKSSGVALSIGSRVTCSDFARIVSDVKAMDGIAVMMSSPGDVCDNVYSDVSVGLGVDVVRFGAPSRGEHIARMNRLIEIEDFIKEDDNLRINYYNSFNFPVIKSPPPEPQSDEDLEGPHQQGTPEPKNKKK